ncbi:MAG: aconitase X [Anaerolineae bacterium]
MADRAAPPLRLTDEEEAMLRGDSGPGVRRAMEMVVALARIYGAADLVPVRSAQVAGVSYANIGDAGLEFLQQWADEGARARVPAFLNPAGMDLEQWQSLAVPADFAAKQLAVVEAYTRMGVQPTCTCAPYLAGEVPAMGEHLAWSESSAVAFANSALGARTNREGGPGALAAAIVGRTGNYGLHQDAGRRPTDHFLVRAPLHDAADWAALGALVGRTGSGVPYLRLADAVAVQTADLDEQTLWDHLRAFGAAAAATGSVALFHVAGITPEDRAGAFGCPSGEATVVDSLAESYASLDGTAESLDVIAIGCPHASIEQVRAAAAAVRGKHLATPLWLMVGRATATAACREGLDAVLAEAGARLVSDTCVVVAPLRSMGIRSVGTDSAKAATYLPGHQGVLARFGTTEQCLDAALRGAWSQPQRDGR